MWIMKTNIIILALFFSLNYLEAQQHINISQNVTSLDFSVEAPEATTLNVNLTMISAADMHVMIDAEDDLGLSLNENLTWIGFSGEPQFYRPFFLTYLPSVTGLHMSFTGSVPDLTGLANAYPNLNSVGLHQPFGPRHEIVKGLEDLSQNPNIKHLSLGWVHNLSGLSEHEKQLYGSMQQLEDLTISIRLASHFQNIDHVTLEAELREVLPNTSIYIEYNRPSRW
jgi:hypothetical protein